MPDPCVMLCVISNQQESFHLKKLPEYDHTLLIVCVSYFVTKTKTRHFKQIVSNSEHCLHHLLPGRTDEV
jgi:hypothetical protein